jgi:YVTN family beta-propeller protein
MVGCSGASHYDEPGDGEDDTEGSDSANGRVCPVKAVSPSDDHDRRARVARTRRLRPARPRHAEACEDEERCGEAEKAGRHPAERRLRPLQIGYTARYGRRIYEVNILGPLVVKRAGREVTLAAGKQRALLLLLVLHRDEPVSPERLADELWDGSAAAGAPKTVQVYVSRLRTALGDEAVVRAGSGYALAAGRVNIDADNFEELVAKGAAQLGDGNAGSAAVTIRAALRLWRGSALAGFEYEDWARLESARLEELRLQALELRIEADLQLGRHAALVAELVKLAAEAPLRERLLAQLMLALYRSGRQADSLAVFAAARRRLVDELGLEPGPELQSLQRRILAHDPSLRAPPTGIRLRRQRGGLLVAVGGAALALAAIATAIAIRETSGGAHLSRALPDSLAVIDSRTNAVTSDVPIGAGPAAVAVAHGSAWVADAGDQTIAQVTPDGVLVGRTGLTRIPSQLASGAGALWIASSTGQRGVVLRFDPTSARITGSETVRVGFGAGDDLFSPATPSAIAVGEGGVWTNDLRQRVWELRPHGVQTWDLPTPDAADGIALGAGSVWVSSSARDRVLRLDPRTGRVEARVPIVAGNAHHAGPYGIAFGDGAVWVADALAGTVSRINAQRNRVAATIRVETRPTHIAVGDGAVWVLNAGAGTVSRIDPRRNSVVATIHVGPDATGIAAGLGSVWVTLAGGSPPGETTRERSQPLQALPYNSCSPVLHGSGQPQLLIASDLPTDLAGAQTAVIRDWRAAIVAVLRAHRFRAGPYRIGYQACDDSLPNSGADPARCAANARSDALDQSLVGVIGPRESFCAELELPTLNAAPGGPVPMISASNTYVGLTHAGPATAADEPDRYYPTAARTYVRLVGSDDYQSAGLVLFLEQLGRHRVYVLDDGQGTGYAGAVYAERAARRLGLLVVGRATWNPDAAEYGALVRRIARSHADAVVLSGCICSNGSGVVADLRRGLPRNVTLIGTDNFGGTDSFFGPPGDVFAGMYSTAAYPPPQALSRAGRAFLARLLPGRALDDIDPNVTYAAEAARLLLQAIAHSQGTRGSVSRQLLRTRDPNGLAGPVSFDANGDPSPTPIAVYRVDPWMSFKAHRDGQGLIYVRTVQPPRSLAR